MRNVTMDDPLTTQEIYDELFNFKESLKQLTDRFGELANGIMLSLANRAQDGNKGKWVFDRTLEPHCSECNYVPDYSPRMDDYFFSDFCPNCGADMRGDDK